MKKFIVHIILGIIAVSALFRGLYFGYETYGIMAIISLLSFLYFFIKIRNNEEIHINKIYTVLSIVLIVAYAIAFINAVNPRANIGSILLYTELAIVFHVLYDYFYDKKMELIQEIMWMVVTIGVAVAIIGLEALTYSFSALDLTIFDKRLGSTFAYRNTAAIYLSICILFALTLINITKRPVLKCLLAGVGSINILALFMTGSRGGWLVGSGLIFIFMLIQPGSFKIKSLFSLVSMMIPIIISANKFNAYADAHDYIHATFWISFSFVSGISLFLSYLFLTWTIKKYILKGKELIAPKGTGILAVVVVIGAIICTFVFWKQFISILPSALGNRFKNMTLNDPSILLRLENDVDALKLIANNWITGLGGGGWQAQNQSVQEVYYSITLTHDNYLQVFVESGVIGFLSYTMLITISLINLVKKFFKASGNVQKTAVSGILCGFAVLAIHSSFDFDLTYVSLDLLLWVMFTVAATKTENSNHDVKINSTINNRFIKTVPLLTCGILISMNSLYFSAAYNGQQAMKYTKLESYKSVVLFYEEAVRLDPQNSEYTSELARTYYFLADIAQNEKEQKEWLDKAIPVGEQSVNSNKYFSPYVRTLIRIYMSVDNPEKVLEYSKILVSSERCFGSNYEVLAKAYLDAANYYAERNDIEKEKKLLNECISIEKDPNLCNIIMKTPSSLLSIKPESDSQPSENLQTYISEAKERLKKME